MRFPGWRRVFGFCLLKLRRWWRRLGLLLLLSRCWGLDDDRRWSLFRSRGTWRSGRLCCGGRCCRSFLGRGRPFNSRARFCRFGFLFGGRGFRRFGQRFFGRFQSAVGELDYVALMNEPVQVTNQRILLWSWGGRFGSCRRLALDHRNWRGCRGRRKRLDQLAASALSVRIDIIDNAFDPI